MKKTAVILIASAIVCSAAGGCAASHPAGSTAGSSALPSSEMSVSASISSTVSAAQSSSEAEPRSSAVAKVSSAVSSAVKKAGSSVVPDLPASASPYPVTTAPAVVDDSPNAKQAAALCAQSFTYYNTKCYAKAEQLADQAIALDSNCYVGYNLKGISMCYLGDVPGGRKLIDRSITMNPGYAYAYFNKAMSFKFHGKYYDAGSSITCFLKDISISPSDAWAYYGISTVYADAGDVQNSLTYLKKSIAIDPSIKATARVQDHFDKMRSNPDFIKLVS